jgi:cobalt-zinc-cadmium efflux system outer membrane protein
MRVFSVALITSVLLVTASASGQTPVRVRLDDLVAEALAKNPDVIVAQRRYDAARQRPAQERSLPDPMVSAGYNSSGNPLPGAGLGTEPTANIGFMVSQELPYPGKRGLRASIAARDADAEFQQIEAVRLAIVARVKQAYYRLAYTSAGTDVLTRNRELLTTLLRVSENRYTVGEAAQQDVIKAQTQISILDLQLERVRQERAIREGELNALLARSVDSRLGEPEEMQLTGFDISLASLIDASQANAPMLKRDQTLIVRSQLAIDAARKEYKPDFGVSGGYYYMGSMPAMYEFRFDVKIPLQRERRAAAVAEQVSTAEQVRSAYDSTRLGLQARIQEDYQMAATAARLARMYRDTVLPQARLALESSIASYQTGRVDFLSVVTNFATVLEYEMSYVDELASFHTAVSRLEEMTGTPLVH